MCGASRPDRAGKVIYTYYVCPRRPGNPRDTRRCPEHVTASLREDVITAAISAFVDQYVLGYDRDAMLAAHLPQTAADAAARRDAAAADLTRRLARNEAASKGLMTELAQLGDDASTAYRTRIRERFTQLYDETAALQAKLGELVAQDTAASDANLIAQLPYAPGLLASAPAPVQETLYAAASTPPTAPTRTRSPSAPSSPTPPPASCRRSSPTPGQTATPQNDHPIRLTSRNLPL
jgi:hypothetical protein